MRGVIRLCIYLLALVSLAACTSPSGRIPVSDKSLVRSLGTGAYEVKSGDTLYSISLAFDLDYRRLAEANGIGRDYAIYPGQIIQLSYTPTVSSTQSSNTDGRTQDKSTAKSRPPVIVVRSAGGEVAGKASSPTRSSVRKPTAGTQSAAVTAKAVAKSSSKAVKPSASAVKATKSSKSNSSQSVKVAGSIKWQWPSTGPVIEKFNLKGDVNKGINVAGNKGDPVFAAADGKVVFVGSGLQGYGNLVIIDHNTRFLSAYAHNSRLLVKERAVVKAGQKIAEMGSSDAERVMLHFEVRRDGIPVNPLRYLPIR